jgi:hypothetical protein
MWDILVHPAKPSKIQDTELHGLYLRPEGLSFTLRSGNTKNLGNIIALADRTQRCLDINNKRSIIGTNNRVANTLRKLTTQTDGFHAIAFLACQFSTILLGIPKSKMLQVRS